MSFASDIKKATEKYKVGYKEVIAESLFKVSRSVVLMTPEDTGRAQGNWHASINGYNQSISNSTTRNFDQIENITDQASGNTFYLINNLPYIGRLEFDGYSEKALGGMVRVSIENFQQMLDETIENHT